MRLTSISTPRAKPQSFDSPALTLVRARRPEIPGVDSGTKPGPARSEPDASIAVECGSRTLGWPTLSDLPGPRVRGWRSLGSRRPYPPAAEPGNGLLYRARGSTAGEEHGVMKPNVLCSYL